jgi:hypothetical protein
VIVHLVPPTLIVLGKIISKRIPLTEHFASVYEWLHSAWTLDDCVAQGFPRLQFIARGIGGGLVVASTADDTDMLLWIYEVSCHELCGVVGGRKCTHLLPILERAKLIEKNHKNLLQTMPGHGKLLFTGNSAQLKGIPK